MAVSTGEHTTQSGSKHATVADYMDYVKRVAPHQPEFQQAVQEVVESVLPIIEKNPDYQQARILERLIIPDRVYTFRVNWVDDNGRTRINQGYRIEMNGAIGPYKGGLRFHPSVNLSILKFLAFEQVFKNSLTTLPMGGGKGGSDFDPRGCSDNEVMRFCHAFMNELYRYIGPEIDVPAGDIGTGAREIGYLFGQYRKLTNRFNGVLTGKGPGWGGSQLRAEATGYGAVYFAQNMLAAQGQSLEGKKALVSGAGNVAQYTVEKLNELGAIPITLSDSGGTIVDNEGITPEKLAWVMELKNQRRGRISEYAQQFPNASFLPKQRPWHVPADAAFPSATQNEIEANDAEDLVKNGCTCVSEGANMPSSPEAIKCFLDNKILFGPGKAANAGGVAVSGLEMTQNSGCMRRSREEVDRQLVAIMHSIHDNCVKYGQEGDFINYVKGANVAGFVKVADAMLQLGIS